MAVCLFFFFLVLIPYFSLRYDSKSISRAESVFVNTSNIISALDKTINDSKNIQSIYSSLVSESKDTISRIDVYNN